MRDAVVAESAGTLEREQGRLVRGEWTEIEPRTRAATTAPATATIGRGRRGVVRTRGDHERGEKGDERERRTGTEIRIHDGLLRQVPNRSFVTHATRGKMRDRGGALPAGCWRNRAERPDRGTRAITS